MSEFYSCQCQFCHFLREVEYKKCIKTFLKPTRQAQHKGQQVFYCKELVLIEKRGDYKGMNEQN